MSVSSIDFVWTKLMQMSLFNMEPPANLKYSLLCMGEKKYLMYQIFWKIFGRVPGDKPAAAWIENIKKVGY